MKQAIIDIQNVSKSYNEGLPVLHDVSLKIGKGEFVTIIGPSGCGKTTLLRLIKSMTSFDSGQIMVMGRSIEAWDKIQLRRSIGYVIQQGGLFPHLSITQNIAFVLSISAQPRQKISERVEEMAALMNFDEWQLNAFPSELSEGQQQRVGVARALATKPEIVLK
jgi:osmoprotectant transport system ATP-binding protein